ncbi:MAG: GIY-YIG nuclease family protein [Patescibacteria group bacterium]|jgi:putative endonuclease
MKPSVYILKLDDGSYYIGSTRDLKRRIAEHRKGLKASTRFSKNPQIVFFQNFETYHQARIIEIKLKSYKSRKVIEKIIKEGKINKL